MEPRQHVCPCIDTATDNTAAAAANGRTTTGSYEGSNGKEPTVHGSTMAGRKAGKGLLNGSPLLLELTTRKRNRMVVTPMH